MVSPEQMSLWIILNGHKILYIHIWKQLNKRPWLWEGGTQEECDVGRYRIHTWTFQEEFKR